MKEIPYSQLTMNPMTLIAKEWMLVTAGNEQTGATGIAPEDYTADVSDSLLNIWYAHRMANDAEDIEDYDMDSVKFESNVPDSVYIRRLEKMNSFINSCPTSMKLPVDFAVFSVNVSILLSKCFDF